MSHIPDNFNTGAEGQKLQANVNLCYHPYKYTVERDPANWEFSLSRHWFVLGAHEMHGLTQAEQQSPGDTFVFFFLTDADRNRSKLPAVALRKSPAGSDEMSEKARRFSESNFGSIPNGMCTDRVIYNSENNLCKLGDA